MTLPDDVKAEAAGVLEWSMDGYVDPPVARQAIERLLPIITPAIERATIERCSEVLDGEVAAWSQIRDKARSQKARDDFNLMAAAAFWARIAIRALLPEGGEP